MINVIYESFFDNADVDVNAEGEDIKMSNGDMKITEVEICPYGIFAGRNTESIHAALPDKNKLESAAMFVQLRKAFDVIIYSFESSSLVERIEKVEFVDKENVIGYYVDEEDFDECFIKFSEELYNNPDFKSYSTCDMFSVKLYVMFKLYNCGRKQYSDFINLFTGILTKFVSIFGGTRLSWIKIDGKLVHNKMVTNTMANLNHIYNDIFSDAVKRNNFDTDSMLVTPVMEYTGPVTLSSKSRKKSISQFKYGDVLYVQNRNELVSQKTNGKKGNNMPIGIYINNGLFMSFRGCSKITPEKGNERYTEIPFGASRYKIEDFLPKTSYDYSEENMRVLYDFANKSAVKYNFKTLPFKNGTLLDTRIYDDKYSNSGMADDTPQYGSFPVLMAVYRFHTPGTSSGNWILPTMEDLLAIDKDKDTLMKVCTKLIDEKLLSNTYELTDITKCTWTSTISIDDNKNRVAYVNAFGQMDGSTFNTAHKVIPFLKVIDAPNAPK